MYGLFHLVQFLCTSLLSEAAAPSRGRGGGERSFRRPKCAVDEWRSLPHAHDLEKGVKGGWKERSKWEWLSTRPSWQCEGISRNGLPFFVPFSICHVFAPSSLASAIFVNWAVFHLSRPCNSNNKDHIFILSLLTLQTLMSKSIMAMWENLEKLFPLFSFFSSCATCLFHPLSGVCHLCKMSGVSSLLSL